MVNSMQSLQPVEESKFCSVVLVVRLDDYEIQI